MKKNNTRNTIIGLVILAVAVLVIFILAINTPDKKADTVQITAASKQLSKDYNKAYPATPRAVLTEYAEITKCFYDPETKEEQIKPLAEQMRRLFDDELAANQTFDDFVNSLRSEIAIYRKAGKIISSYAVSSSTDVKYEENENGTYATLYVSLNVREDGKINKIKEQFLMRQDQEGHWKILGWVLAEKNKET
ncbi:MAG: hypothetical protein K6G03_12405 [Lachnospiraceae bacterium]|nr:hypothetical protein [Lachnospiraceae bacterium]